MNRLARTLGALALASTLPACGASSGVVAVRPGTFALTEMRAAAAGGGPEAKAAVLAEAATFCQVQGRPMELLTLLPGGDPRGRYWPTAFSATFQCVASNPT